MKHILKINEYATTSNDIMQAIEAVDPSIKNVGELMHDILIESSINIELDFGYYSKVWSEFVPLCHLTDDGIDIVDNLKSDVYGWNTPNRFCYYLEVGKDNLFLRNLDINNQDHLEIVNDINTSIQTVIKRLMKLYNVYIILSGHNEKGKFGMITSEATSSFFENYNSTRRNVIFTVKRK